jgi:SDR family mycofactocin-dependent oxidoreductase
MAVGRLDEKVAFITGAARGQGRSHAVRMAEEGADIIGVDICEEIASVPYALGTMAELEETRTLVEALGRRMYVQKADVRSREQLAAAVSAGMAELGRLDIVVCNSGIWSGSPFVDMSDETYHDMIDVQMHGVYNACKATVPHLIEQGEGGSIVIISSTAGLKGFPNQAHYNMAKHGVIGLMRTLANELAPHFIRANSIHPSSTFTKMINNAAIWEVFAPGVENPTEADFGDTFTALNLLPIPWMDPVDISNGVVYLASDESRYVTGVTLPIDAGFMEKV